MQRHMLSAAHPHPQLQAIESIQTPHTFPVYSPASSQQHPDPRVAKAWPRVGELPHPQPQWHLIITGRASIPRRATEPRQATGPLHLHAVGRLNQGGQFAAARGP